MQASTECSVQMDFSENWTTKYQDEPSSVYYDKAQTTVHPMVVHYIDDHGQLKVRSYTGIGDETSHAAPTVYAFVSVLVAELPNLLPNLVKIHFISDSPRSQYRNKTIVAMLSKFRCLFGLYATWTCLEAGHGKGPCDGIGWHWLESPS